MKSNYFYTNDIFLLDIWRIVFLKNLYFFFSFYKLENLLFFFKYIFSHFSFFSKLVMGYKLLCVNKLKLNLEHNDGFFLENSDTKHYNNCLFLSFIYSNI